MIIKNKKGHGKRNYPWPISFLNKKIYI